MHIFGNVLGGTAGAPGQVPVEFPQKFLLLSALSGDRLRSTRDPAVGWKRWNRVCGVAAR